MNEACSLLARGRGYEFCRTGYRFVGISPLGETLTRVERPGALGCLEPFDSMIGTTVGKYRIVALLGHGATGIVYRALDHTLDREVASARPGGLDRSGAMHDPDGFGQTRSQLG